MRLNADFDRPVVIRPTERTWTSSPSRGVDRCMLDRIGDEVARATSIVRFAPGSSFPTHRHTGGEEFIVLDGVFSDETGDFPAGTYVRNPIGTAHAPHTRDGCTIFVKLWQFDDDDSAQFDLDMAGAAVAVAPGLRVATLHRDQREHVTHTIADAGTALGADGAGGTEILVLEGAVITRDGTWPEGTWARLPDGAPWAATAGPDGARVWMKNGHLPHARAPQI